MNREEIKRYVGVTARTLGQVEKDYFQHVVLGAISRRAAGTLVFKGGTMLQKTGVVRRFSEDLDFTASGPVRRLEEPSIRAIEVLNHRASTDRQVDDERTTGFRLRIEGPLFRERRGICTIRVEVSVRESVVLEPGRFEFDPPYPEVLPYVLATMRPEEVLAEKVRAILSRQKARDLHDVHMLIKKGTELRVDLVDRKLEYYGMEFDPDEFIARCEVLGHDWETELPPLMDRVEPFEDAMDSVRVLLSGQD